MGDEAAPAPARPVVYTNGHGVRPAEALTAVLLDAGVTTLEDVRRYPMSRRHPQYNREALAVDQPAVGIRYEWQGDELGGRRSRRDGSRHTALRDPGFAGYADHMDTPGFRAAVEALVRRASHGERPAVMCAETVWWHCHRMLIADALASRGVEVIHLMDVGRRQAYRPHPTMRPGADGWPVYDVPDTIPGLG